MIESGDFIHYGTIALTMGISSIGVGLGGGMISGAALDAINKQPAARDDISRGAILGMALIETASIMGFSMATILLRGTPVSSYGYCAELGIAFAVCIPGLAIGLLSALPPVEACYAIARQPFFGQKIGYPMVLAQSILQTPIIFGFIVAVMIKNQAATIQTFEECLKLIASGVCIGLGSIGPAIGLARFAQTACRGIGINRDAYNKIFSFMLISEAMIETPVIFSLIISMLILLTPLPTGAAALTKSIALLAAGICMGLGTFGPGVSSGKASSAACEQITLNPEQYDTLSKVSIFGQGMIDTSAIYALLISLWLIYNF